MIMDMSPPKERAKHTEQTMHTSIITLTTDFGTRDGYVGQMKGIILSINPSCMVVDITHDITPFAVREAALVVKGISSYFPPRRDTPRSD